MSYNVGTPGDYLWLAEDLVQNHMDPAIGEPEHLRNNIAFLAGVDKQFLVNIGGMIWTSANDTNFRQYFDLSPYTTHLCFGILAAGQGSVQFSSTAAADTIRLLIDTGTGRTAVTQARWWWAVDYVDSATATARQLKVLAAQDEIHTADQYFTMTISAGVNVFQIVAWEARRMLIVQP